MKFTASGTLLAAMSVVFASAAVAGDPEDKAHMRGSVEAEMRIMDTNKDGKISATEHAAGAQQMFQGMDGNQDSRVTAVEMDAAHKPLKGHDASHGHDGDHKPQDKAARHMSSAEKIKVIDTDGDGVLTAQEHAAGSKKMFSKMDADKDGFLTAAEINAGHQRMMTVEDR